MERWQRGSLVELLVAQSSDGTRCALVLNRAETVAPVQFRMVLSMFGWGHCGVNRCDV